MCTAAGMKKILDILVEHRDAFVQGLKDPILNGPTEGEEAVCLSVRTNIAALFLDAIEKVDTILRSVERKAADLEGEPLETEPIDLIDALRAIGLEVHVVDLNRRPEGPSMN